jgi:hypothetical protein
MILYMPAGVQTFSALSPLLFSFALEHALSKVQEIQMVLKLNGTHQLLVYANDMNRLGDNVDTIKNTETLIDASKEVGLEVNAEKTKYMLLSPRQNAGQNHNTGTFQIFGNESNKYKLYSAGN